MKEIIQYISANWIGWLFTTLFMILTLGYRKIISQFKEEYKKNESIHVGVQALLRDRMIQAYNYWQQKGYCPIYGKENFNRMYDAYHDLGGNDVATKLKDTLLAMPEKLEEREREK